MLSVKREKERLKQIQIKSILMILGFTENVYSRFVKFVSSSIIEHGKRGQTIKVDRLD
jgi:hypothetical protein